MNNSKEISASIININLRWYNTFWQRVGLFKESYLRYKMAKIRGSAWGVIGNVNYGDFWSGHTSFLYGEFYKFLDVDPAESCFCNDNAPLLEHIHSRVIKIPYAFYPERGILFVDDYRFSSSSAKKLIDGLFCDKWMKDKFGDVVIVIERGINNDDAGYTEDIDMNYYDSDNISRTQALIELSLDQVGNFRKPV